MPVQKIRRTKEKETYLATLYGKALDAQVAQPILGDRFAAAAVARIDYDFKLLKLPNGGASRSSCPAGRSRSMPTAGR